MAAAGVRYLALSALAVLSCLQTVTPTSSSQLSQPHALDAASTATTPQLLPVAEAASGDGHHQALIGRACTYTVKVKTSCASPRRSSDAVSLAFGDAYRNEVYVAQLAPRAGFERCATDTFRVSGPCGYGVCYLYLRRTGADRGGWTPEWVRVYEPTTSAPSTFYYGDAFPSGVWYGFNRCVRRAQAAAGGEDDEASSSVSVAGQ